MDNDYSGTKTLLLDQSEHAQLYRPGRSRLLSADGVKWKTPCPRYSKITCGGIMSIAELLLHEFDAEMKTTRTTLERVPFDKTGFAPHPKSMKLEKLAPHVAELPGFGLTILTTPSLDFGTAPSRPRPPFEQAGMLKFFDEGSAKTRAALKGMADKGWTDMWKLSFNGKTIFEGERFLAYREMFLNHLVHHRAQLGVYLRLNDKPLPATYGPSADDTMGF
jgi:hypothetical protein